MNTKEEYLYEHVANLTNDEIFNELSWHNKHVESKGGIADQSDELIIRLLETEIANRIFSPESEIKDGLKDQNSEGEESV